MAGVFILEEARVAAREMSGRRLFGLVLLWASLVTPTAAVAAGPIVLIVVDTLRADHLPCYGYGRPTAPAMCALARDGVLFERALTPRTATTPAIASMLTGLHPHRHGLRDLYMLLPSEMETLAEVLGAAGFATGAFVSSFVMVDDFSGLAQGFALYDDDVRMREPYRENFERPAGQTVERALRWLETAGPRSFLFLHLIEPHGPYTPRTPYLERFSLAAEGPELPPAVPTYQRIPGIQLVSELVGRYDGEIAAADVEVGRVLAFLRQRDWYDGATIVLVADHGESMGEEGQWFQHGFSVHDAEAHVPLIVKFAGTPGEPAPGTRHVFEPVSLVDVFPTLLAAAVGRASADSAASDLRRVAMGEGRRLPPPLTELRTNDGYVVVAHGTECSVRWKLLRHTLTPDLRMPEPSAATEWATRSVAAHRFPAEATAECVTALIASVRPLMVDLFTFKLGVEVVSRSSVQLPGGKSAFLASRRFVPLSDGEREALRHLGYLE